jgi:hypothetical protein
MCAHVCMGMFVCAHYVIMQTACLPAINMEQQSRCEEYQDLMLRALSTASCYKFTCSEKIDTFAIPKA